MQPAPAPNPRLRSFASFATVENKAKLQAISVVTKGVGLGAAYALCSFSLKQFLKHFSTEKTVRHTFLLRFCNHDKCALCSECNAPRRVFTADSMGEAAGVRLCVYRCKRAATRCI